jgi:lipoprotein Spr
MYNWVGTPYQFGGSTKNGIDCSGFTKMLVEEIYKITLTRDSRSMYKQCNPVSKSDLKEGDLVFFNISRGQISHVGVYLGNNKFIHSSTQKGVIMSDLREGYYKRYFYKGGRLIPNTIK